MYATFSDCNRVFRIFHKWRASILTNFLTYILQFRTNRIDMKISNRSSMEMFDK